MLGLTILTLSTSAHADYAEDVPEGDNAATLHRGDKRVALIGATAIGITDHTELSTVLLLDAALFPNLQLEHRFVDGDLAASWSVGLGAGGLPVVAGAALPMPGAIVGAGGVGLALAAEQHAAIHVTWHASPRIAVTATGGAFALEGGFVGVAAGAGVGGGGVMAGAAPLAAGASRVGPLAGLELAAVASRRDAIVLAIDGYAFAPYVQDGPRGLLYGRLLWTHAWEHLGLSLGAYSLADPPRFRVLRDAKVPVGPFANVAWMWH